jgi:pimeloyl-ACP methyl ester carboxylesterase
MSAFMLACLALAGVSGQTESSRSFSKHFVEANEISLHYLDCGGQGEPVVFLTGFGTPAATFNDLAVGLRDRFHVYALTRRGFPPSQTPASGYELATLVADIMAFLDAKELPRVHLVGHSLAGLELTQIASRWYTSERTRRGVVKLFALSRGTGHRRPFGPRPHGATANAAASETMFHSRQRRRITAR